MPNHFTPVKEPPYPLYRILGDAQNRCELLGTYEQILLSLGIDVRTHGRLVYSLVAIWTVLSRLQCAKQTELYLEIHFVLSTR
jgi:hypothetical protein